MRGRIKRTFQTLSAENRAGLIAYIMAGDPDLDVTLALARGLAKEGVDIIELGFPFTDPMADGPVIQRAALRSLKSGTTLRKVLELVTRFRADNQDTPIVLMGYFNPIYAYGVDKFLVDAKTAGVDGLIVVDLPPEEDVELRDPASKAGIDFIRLATPTTDLERRAKVVNGASGFIYYVSVAGITGGASGDNKKIAKAVSEIKVVSGLPVAVGFGVKTTEKASEIAQIADAVVVGSAFIEKMEEKLDAPLDPGAQWTENDPRINAVLSFARDLKKAVRGARQKQAP